MGGSGGVGGFYGMNKDMVKVNRCCMLYSENRNVLVGVRGKIVIGGEGNRVGNLEEGGGIGGFGGISRYDGMVLCGLMGCQVGFVGNGCVGVGCVISVEGLYNRGNDVGCIDEVQFYLV